MADMAEERLRELRSADSLVESIKLRKSNPDVHLPMAPVNLSGVDSHFKKGNDYGKSDPGEYRVAIREALNENPQLWVKIYNRMTPTQRNFMVVLSDSIKLEDCFVKMSEKYGDSRYVWANRWRSWTEVIREGILFGSKALVEDAANAATAIKKAYLTKAALVKVSGLDSDDEKTRQNVATELLEWEFGRAGVRVTTETDDKLGDVYQRMTTALEKAAGITPVLEGDYAVNVTPEDDAADTDAEAAPEDKAPDGEV